MIILLDAHMVGENETGNETYVVNLVRGLRALGTADRFLLATTNPALLGERIPFDDAFQPVPVSASPIRRLLVDLPAVAKAAKADIMHVTYAGPLSPPCPLVAAVHDVSYGIYPSWFSLRDRLVLEAGVRWTVRRARRILTVSRHSREDICRRYGLPVERVVVTSGAAGDEFCRIEDKRTIRTLLDKYGSSQPYVLAVGSIRPRKNHERLINALALAKARAPIPHKLVIVGAAGGYANTIREAAARKIGRDEVIFPGYVPQADLPVLYSGADVFAYPSLYEGFGLPILEAMACGTPVLTSNLSSMPEVAGQAAVLVDPWNTESIAQGLRTLLLDQAARQEYRARGLIRVGEFSWLQTARVTHDVYRSVVAEDAPAWRGKEE